MVRGVAKYRSFCAFWGERTLRGSNPLRGSIAFIIHCIHLLILCLNSKNANAWYYSHMINLTLYLNWNVRNSFQGLIILQED